MSAEPQDGEVEEYGRTGEVVGIMVTVEHISGLNGAQKRHLYRGVPAAVPCAYCVDVPLSKYQSGGNKNPPLKRSPARRPVDS